MKKLNKLILVAVSILFAITANAQNITNKAQNKFTVNYGENNYFTVTSTKDMVFEQKGDNVILGRMALPNSIPVKNEAEMHSLTICPEGNWDFLVIHSSNGYHNDVYSFMSPEGLCDIVEDGDYEVFVRGENQEGNTFISTYFLSVYEDTTFTPTACSDATHEISVIGVDEYGHSLSEKYIKLMYYDVMLHWSGEDYFILYLCGTQNVSQLSNLKFNDLTELDRISVHAWMATFDNESWQKHYFIQYPAIVGSDNMNWTIENNMEDMKTHEENFVIADGNEGYYYVDYCKYIGSENYDYVEGVNRMAFGGFNSNCTFNPNEPIIMVTNIDVRDPNMYEEGEIKIKLSPNVYQTMHLEDVRDRVMSPFMYYDANGILIREPFDEFENFFSHDQTPYFFTSTPVSNLYLDKNLIYGERTPIAYFQSRNYNEFTSPWGDNFCEGQFKFIGENGCQREGDEFSMIQVKINDEEVFYDKLFYYNQMVGGFGLEEPGVVQIEILNDHLVFDGIEKTNKTSTTFDLNLFDAIPPTLTILQVMDENNNEQVYLSNYTNAHINFAAGDFTGHIDEVYETINYMQYQDKPNVEVFYSIDNGEWTSLEYTEDQTMFHPNYGNFFTIDLSQLDASVADKWVSLKFIVTDEVGNTQTQELSNVFYAGENVSVNEHTAEGLQHAVYPNPFSSEVKITTAQSVNGVVNIAVYNILGEQVYSKTKNCTETKEFTIDGSTWKAGVYFYSISTDDGLLQGKIVKE